MRPRTVVLLILLIDVAAIGAGVLGGWLAMKGYTPW